MKIKIFESYDDLEQLQEEVNAFLGCGIEVLKITHSSVETTVVEMGGYLPVERNVIHHTIVVSYA